MILLAIVKEVKVAVGETLRVGDTYARTRQAVVNSNENHRRLRLDHHRPTVRLPRLRQGRLP